MELEITSFILILMLKVNSKTCNATESMQTVEIQ